MSYIALVLLTNSTYCFGLRTDLPSKKVLRSQWVSLDDDFCATILFGKVLSQNNAHVFFSDWIVVQFELISLNMTEVLLVHSSQLARWAFLVRPQNLLLAGFHLDGCHVPNFAMQANQLCRVMKYKKENG